MPATVLPVGTIPPTPVIATAFGVEPFQIPYLLDVVYVGIDPTPVPTPVPTPPILKTPAVAASEGAVRPIGVAQWESLVRAYFPAENVGIALVVMRCESGGDPNAYNASTATGLFQIIPLYHQQRVPGRSLFDPAANVEAAALISGGGVDWTPWNASRHCWG